jgi:hypothetical protein
MEYRVILYHKQASSARTRFLRFAHESVCAFTAIPRFARLVEGEAGKMVVHPSAVLREVESRLGLASGSLKAETGYRRHVSSPDGSIQIILACIDTLDPPFEALEKTDARFIDLTQSRGLPRIEMELLRHAYELVMGGY